jgi:hypothetical protein
MMRKTTVACVLSLAAVLACSSDEPAGPAGEIDYEGSWTGDMGDPNTVLRTSVTWTPTHTGNSVTGRIDFQLTSTLTARGTLAGTVVGTVIDFTLTVPAGSYPAPVSQACTLTGTGSSSTATDHDIVATLALTYTAPCLGTLTSVLTTNHRLRLIKVE